MKMSEFTNDELMEVCTFLIKCYVTDDKTTETEEIGRIINRIILKNLDI